MALQMPQPDSLPTQAEINRCGPHFADGSELPADVATIELDEHGLVSMRIRTVWMKSDAIPGHVFHRRRLTYQVPSGASRAALAAGLEPGGWIFEALARIHAGHTIGKLGDVIVGDLDEDALEASVYLTQGLTNIERDITET